MVLFLFAGGAYEKIFSTFFIFAAVFGYSRCLPIEGQKKTLTCTLKTECKGKMLKNCVFSGIIGLLDESANLKLMICFIVTSILSFMYSTYGLVLFCKVSYIILL